MCRLSYWRGRLFMYFMRNTINVVVSWLFFNAESGSWTRSFSHTNFTVIERNRIIHKTPSVSTAGYHCEHNRQDVFQVLFPLILSSGDEFVEVEWSLKPGLYCDEDIYVYTLHIDDVETNYI